MPLSAGQAVPHDVLTALTNAGVRGPCLLLVVKQGCGACEDALPLLDAALEGVDGVIMLAQEDAPTAHALGETLAPHLAVVGDDAPHQLSAALEVQWTPTVLLIEDGRISDVTDGFDPDGFHRLLLAHSVARGLPAFHLFAPGEARPPFRPG